MKLQKGGHFHGPQSSVRVLDGWGGGGPDVMLMCGTHTKTRETCHPGREWVPAHLLTESTKITGSWEIISQDDTKKSDIKSAYFCS